MLKTSDFDLSVGQSCLFREALDYVKTEKIFRGSVRKDWEGRLLVQ